MYKKKRNALKKHRKRRERLRTLGKLRGQKRAKLQAKQPA